MYVAREKEVPKLAVNIWVLLISRTMVLRQKWSIQGEDKFIFKDTGSIMF